MAYVNTPITFPLTLSYQGTPFDAASVKLTFISPYGVKTCYTLDSPEMQHPTTGQYLVEFTPNAFSRPGHPWKYSWTAVKSGGKEFYDKGEFEVLERDV